MRWLQRQFRENRGFLIFLALMAVFRSAVADWNPVPTGSMLPTIQEGDVLGTDKLAYDLRVPFTHVSLHRFADPQRGDVVIFDSKRADTRLVKRVIGLPGDTVAMRDNVIILNGRPLAYDSPRRTAGTTEWVEHLEGRPHVTRRSDASYHPLRNFGPVVVPRGHYLMLGDNRDNSADSRVYGFVPREEIVGRAGHVLASFDLDRYLLPRLERFWSPLP